MFTTVQVLQILQQVVTLAHDEELLSSDFLSEGGCLTPEEILQRFLVDNQIVILRSSAITTSALEKRPVGSHKS